MPGSVLLQLSEDLGALQSLAGCGLRGIDRVAPRGSVFLVNQLSNGDFGEVRITQKLGAIEKSSPKSFDRVMNGSRRPVLHFSEIVAFEDVQRLDQHRSTRGRRGSADDLITAICAADRF